MRELVDRASRRGFDPLRVNTDTPWTEAVNLYLACGFVPVGVDETDSYFTMSLTT